MYNVGIFGRDVPLVDDVAPSEHAEETLNSIIDRIVNDLYFGVGAPDAALGEETDTYIDLSGLTFYVRDLSGWDAGSPLGNTSTDTVLGINGEVS